MPGPAIKITRVKGPKSAKALEKEYLARRAMQGRSGQARGYNPYRDTHGRFATGPHKAKEKSFTGPKRVAATVGAFHRARKLAAAQAAVRRSAAPAASAMTKVRRRLQATGAARAAAARVAAPKPTATKPAAPKPKPAAAAAPQARARRPRRTAAEMRVVRKQQATARAEREARRTARAAERDQARIARKQQREARTQAARERSAAQRPGSARRAIAVASKPGATARPTEAKPARAAREKPKNTLGGRTVQEWNQAAVKGRWHPISPTVARSALQQLQGGGSKLSPQFAHRISEYAVQLGIGRHQAEHHVHQMVLAGAARLGHNPDMFTVTDSSRIPQQRFITARGTESHRYSSSGAGHFAGGTRAPAAEQPAQRPAMTATKITPIHPNEFRAAVRRLQGVSSTSLSGIRSTKTHTIADIARELGVTRKQVGFYLRQQGRTGAVSLSHDDQGLPTFRVTNEYDLTPQKLLGTQKSSVMVAQRRALEAKPAGRTEQIGGRTRERPAAGTYRKSQTNEGFAEHFGRSNATIRLGSGMSGRYEISDVVHAGRQIFGHKFEEHHLASLMGAPDGSDVIVAQFRTSVGQGVAEEGPMIRLRCEAPGYSSIRTFHLDDDGKPVIHNDYQVVQDTGSGMGARAFGRQVEQATRLGVTKLETHAAGHYGDPVFNGYYTWAVFGYDAVIPSHVRNILRSSGPQGLRESTHVSELMETEEGRKFWKEKGSDLYHAAFDLNPTSDSHKAWEAYRERRRQQGRAI